MRIFKHITLLLLLVLATYISVLSANEKIAFTPEELEFINNSDVLKVANETDWPPFDFVQSEEPTGYSIELIQLIADKTGLKIEFINGYSWSELLELFKDGSIDILPVFYLNEDRKEFISYTESYASNPSVLVVNSNSSIKNLDDLSEKKVAVIRGYATTIAIEERYNNIERVYVENAAEGINEVSSGNVDGFIGSLGTVGYYINKKFIPNVKIIGNVDLKSTEETELYIGVAKENTILRNILQKGLDNISQGELKEIRQKWFLIEVEESNINIADLNVSEILKILFGLLLLSVLLIATIRYMINRWFTEHTALQFGSLKFRLLAIGAVAIIIIAVVLIGVFSTRNIKKRILNDVENNLQTILESNNARLEIWIEQQKDIANRLARNPLLEQKVEDILLDPTKGKVDLKLSIDDLFDKLSIKDNEYIIFDILGTSLYNNTRLSEREVDDFVFLSLKYINDVLKGETIFLSPNADTFLKAEKSPLSEAILILTPIGQEGNYPAVLVHKVDPSKDFSDILKLSKVGESGESYAFDKYGSLITESRFKKEIIDLGLIKSNQNTIFNLQIKNPGGDLTSGYEPVLPRDEQPSTLMAKSALQGESGINTNGYRDYRGVLVFGAWVWSHDYGFGHTTEIDVNEAMSTYRILEYTIYGGLGLTLLLSIGALVFTLTIGMKINKSLLKQRAVLEDTVNERTKDLSASEERFRSIIEVANTEAIIVADESSKIMLWNQGAQNIFGYSDKDVMGKSVSLLIPDSIKPDHDSGFEMAIDKGKLKHENKSLETTGVTKNGKEIKIELSIGFWKVGNKKYFSSIIRDITEQKVMQRKLEKAFDTIKSQKERMEKELNVAKDIQASMLPIIFPPFPNLNEFDIYAKLTPAREVGGDFYDFYFIDDHKLCFTIGDVSGKGVPAALLMAETKTLLKSVAINDSSAASIMTQVNNEIAQNNTNYMFVTVFLGILDTNTGKLIYCNAGHNPTFIKKQNGEVVKLKELHGPVIGAMEGITYKENSTQLVKDDYVLLYTDGVTEAQNLNKDLFGDDKLHEIIKSGKYNSVETLIDAIFQSVNEFENGAEPFDDVTALSLRFNRDDSRKELHDIQISLKNDLQEISSVIDQFQSFAVKNKVNNSAIQKISIAFDELLNNTISYSFDDNMEHTLQVDIGLYGDRLVIKIQDDGLPFNPFIKDPPDTKLGLQDREIGGLGIHLVKNIMDEYDYKRVKEHNVVTLAKYNVLT